MPVSTDYLTVPHHLALPDFAHDCRRHRRVHTRVVLGDAGLLVPEYGSGDVEAELPLQLERPKVTQLIWVPVGRYVRNRACIRAAIDRFGGALAVALHRVLLATPFLGVSLAPILLAWLLAVAL